MYNVQTFTDDNIDAIEEYEIHGGGGTDFDCVFNYLKEEAIDPKRLVMFTDGYPFDSWGDPDYCDTVFIIHGDKNPTSRLLVLGQYTKMSHKQPEYGLPLHETTGLEEVAIYDGTDAPDWGQFT